MSEYVKSEELLPRTGDPLPIRAHHALQLFQILALGWDKDEAEEGAEAYAKAHLPKSYYIDTYGETPESAAAFRERAASFFTEFMALPPDAKVKVVTNQKDAICAACTVGSHCDEWNKGDDSWLQAVKDTAEALGFAEELEPSEETVTLSNGKIRTRSAVTLPAGTARKIYADINFRSRTYPRWAQSFIRRGDAKRV